MEVEPDQDKAATGPGTGEPQGVRQPSPAAPPGGGDATAEEIDRLRAERDAAVSALDKHGRRRRRLARARRILVGVLVAVFSLLLPVTAVVGWAHNTVLNTNGWVRTVGPIATDPAVTAALSVEVTNQLFTALDAQGEIANALPPKASFLAAPITNGVKGYVQTGVDKVLNTPQFHTLWVNANRFAHQQLVKVLRGDTKAVVTTNGEVVLNLVPLINATLQELGPFVSGLVGQTVTLPTLSSNELPASACQRISAALGRPLPTTCGQIPLFPADKLTQAQRIVRAFDRITVLLLVLTPVVGAVALWVSRRRRRTLLQLSVGGLLGLVVFRRAIWWLQGDLVATGKPQNKAARQAILDHATHGFFTLSGWLAAGLAVLAVVALVTGPYRWATATRGYVAAGGRQAWGLGVATVRAARDDRTVVWIDSHMSAMQVGGIVAAVLLMLIFSVSFVGFLVIAAIVVLYELWLRRLQALRPVPTAVDVTEPAVDVTEPAADVEARPAAEESRAGADSADHGASRGA